mmetsp:Transcript_2612/g.4749  ORF Transcript_2612/g.4749 Transcript_2612/m.4749 type:complete len:213 (-) Transcript_2612:428-1066(-)
MNDGALMSTAFKPSVMETRERRILASFGLPSQSSCKHSRQISLSEESSNCAFNRRREFGPNAGVHSLKLTPFSSVWIEFPPMSPEPANPPPPPILLKLNPPPMVKPSLKCVVVFGAFSINRATKKASDGSCICTVMISRAVLIKGGSAIRKNAAAEAYFLFRSKLYAFFSAALRPLSDEKSCARRNFINFVPESDLSVAAIALSVFIFRDAT